MFLFGWKGDSYFSNPSPSRKPGSHLFNWKFLVVMLSECQSAVEKKIDYRSGQISATESENVPFWDNYDLIRFINNIQIHVRWIMHIFHTLLA